MAPGYAIVLAFSLVDVPRVWLLVGGAFVMLVVVLLTHRIGAATSNTQRIFITVLVVAAVIVGSFFLVARLQDNLVVETPVPLPDSSRVTIPRVTIPNSRPERVEDLEGVESFNPKYEALEKRLDALESENRHLEQRLTAAEAGSHLKLVQVAAEFDQRIAEAERRLNLIPSNDDNLKNVAKMHSDLISDVQRILDRMVERINQIDSTVHAVKAASVPRLPSAPVENEPSTYRERTSRPNVSSYPPASSPEWHERPNTSSSFQNPVAPQPARYERSQTLVPVQNWVQGSYANPGFAAFPPVATTVPIAPIWQPSAIVTPIEYPVVNIWSMGPAPLYAP